MTISMNDLLRAFSRNDVYWPAFPLIHHDASRFEIRDMHLVREIVDMYRFTRYCLRLIEDAADATPCRCFFHR